MRTFRQQMLLWWMLMGLALGTAWLTMELLG